MSSNQLAIWEWAKQQGPTFAVMAIVVWVLYGKLNETEQRYEKKLEKIEKQVQDCNQAQVEILRTQIEKNNLLMEHLKEGRK